MLYAALQIGLSEQEFWQLDPFLFYPMIELHIETERRKQSVQ